MASDCTLVKGTRLLYGTDGTTFPNTLADVVELGPPGQVKRPKIDKTPLDPATTNREYAVGLGDPGMQNFKQLWNRTREAALQSLVAAGTPVYWRILYPDSPSNTDANKSHSDFTGILSGCTKETLSSADSRLVLDCEITISGAVTFTAGTGT
jgi:hypothetical protein